MMPCAFANISCGTALRIRATNGGVTLLPPSDARCVLDRDYIVADCGALLSHFEGAAVVALMTASLGLDPGA